MHISSFTPWCRKITRTSCTQNLQQHFPYDKATTKNYRVYLMEWILSPHGQRSDKSFSMKNNDTAAADQINQQDEQVFLTAWIHLLYIGSTMLVKSCTRKITRILKNPCKFTTVYDTTNADFPNPERPHRERTSK